MTDSAGPNYAGSDPAAASQVSSISSVSIVAQIFCDQDTTYLRHNITKILGLYATSSGKRENYQNIRSRTYDTLRCFMRQTI